MTPPGLPRPYRAHVRHRRRVREPGWLASAALAGLLAVSTTGSGPDTEPALTARPDGLRSVAADGGLPRHLFPASPSPLPTAVEGDAMMPLAVDGLGFGIATGRIGYGIPQTVFEAYRWATEATEHTDPSCRLSWPILAGIGKVESGHAWVGALDADGSTSHPILGPVLDGSDGTLALPDTDNGRLDGHHGWDRAVGPMQFIPSTWRTWGVDANGDGRADPANVYDATLAAARYLCAGGRDLSTSQGLRSAILSYNHSRPYLNIVLSWISAYEHGGSPVPDATMTHPVTLTSGESEQQHWSEPAQRPDRGSTRQEGSRSDSGKQPGNDPDSEPTPPPQQATPLVPLPAPTPPTLPVAPTLPDRTRASDQSKRISERVRGRTIENPSSTHAANPQVPSTT